MQLDADTLDGLLGRWPVGRLGTVTPGGAPHLVPVVFVADAGRVCIPVDGKRKASAPLARLRNVETHGRAALLLDHYADDWTTLWWVRLDGPAWVERQDAQTLRRAEARLRDKYPQYRHVPVYSGTPTLLLLRWERVRAWAQSDASHAIRRAAGATPETPGPLNPNS